MSLLNVTDVPALSETYSMPAKKFFLSPVSEIVDKKIIERKKIVEINSITRKNVAINLSFGDLKMNKPDSI